MCADPSVDLKLVMEKFLLQLNMTSQLQDLDDQTISRFCLVARDPPKSSFCNMVEREQACRLARHSNSSLGAGTLWKFVLARASSGNPEWSKGAALVLAARHDMIHFSEDLPCAVLREAVDYLKDREMAVCHARDFFRVDLELEEPREGSTELQVKLLLSMCLGSGIGELSDEDWSRYAAIALKQHL